MPRLFLDSRHARASLGWTVLAFVAAQLALTLVLERCRPDVNDPEFEIRAALLERAHQAEPERPLLLTIGSSRFVTNFRPEWMPELITSAGEKPLAFNFAHYGAGPFVNLVQVNRLLSSGVRPRWLVLEILPSFLSYEGTSFVTTIAATRDLRHLHPYLDRGKLYGRWLRARVLPCCKYRAELCDLVLPALAPDVPPIMRFHSLGGFPEDNPDAETDPALAAQRTAQSRMQYFEPLQQFHISHEGDEAVRQTVAAAQRADVQVVLMINPESSEFRSWYAADADILLGAYCRDLSATYGVPVVDARAWLPDREFMDGHHLFGAAAKRFTTHFARDVLQPLVDGRLQGPGVHRPAPLP
jgi:hypothetical protein